MQIRTRLSGVAAAALALVVATAVTTTAPAPSGAALPACTVTWVSPVDGSWLPDEGWSTGFPPGPDDHVCITVPGDYTVTMDGSTQSVASLRIGPASGTTTPTLHVHGRLSASGGIEVSPRGRLLIQPTSGVAIGHDATIANAGTIDVVGDVEHSASLDSLVNAGTLRVEADLSIADGFTNDGTIITAPGVDVDVQYALWTRAGEASGPGTFTADELRIGDMDASFDVAPAPTFGVKDGGAISFEGDGAHWIEVVGNGADVSGTVRPGQVVRVSDTSLTYTGTWTNQGHIELLPSTTGGAGLTSLEPTEDVFINEGTLSRPAAGSLATVDGASVINRGLVSTSDGRIAVHAADVRNEGTISLARGRLTVHGGDLVLGPTSEVRTNILGGALAIAGRLEVAGSATVDGDLEVLTSYASQPDVGTPRSVVVAGARLGTFDDVRFLGPASYDVATTPTEVRLIRRESEPATQRFVRAAFQDFLGRQPTLDELGQRAAAIDGGTLTRATLVRQLSLSTEYVTDLVQRFYADTLGRPGDPGGVAFWVDQLRTGRKTVAQVAGSFYASEEYLTRVGGIEGAWIEDLYQVFFERLPSTGDRDYWVDRIAARGRTRVATELFQSLESRRQRVHVVYRDLLGRAGDAGGVDYWAGRITSEGDLALAVNLASSAEYLALAQQRYP